MNFSRAAARARARVRLSVRGRRGRIAERIAPAPAACARAGQPRRGPKNLLRPDAGGVPRRAEPDHHRDRAADHRPLFRRFRKPELDRHRLPAHLDRGRAALRQALRHLGPARDDPRRHRPVHRRLGRGGRGTGHDLAHSRPRPAGHRRRRHPAALPVGDRRRGGASRARPLPGLYGRGVGHLRRLRPGVRRHAGRAFPLVADLLGQRAARPWRGAPHPHPSQAHSASRPPPQARRARRRPDDGARAFRSCWR